MCTAIDPTEPCRFLEEGATRHLKNDGYATEYEEALLDQAEKVLMEKGYHTMTHDEVFQGVHARLAVYRDGKR